MVATNSFKDFIPIPFDKEATLIGSEKKKVLFKEALGFISFIVIIILVVIAGFFIYKFLNVPFIIIIILISTEVLVNLVAGLIKYLKIKSIIQIRTNDGRDFKKIIITGAYYNLIHSIFSFSATVVSISIIFSLIPNLFYDLIDSIALFSETIVSIFVTLITILLLFTRNVSTSAEWNNINLNLSFLIFIYFIFRFIKFIISLIKYNAIKNIRDSNNFAEVNKDFSIVEQKISLGLFIFMGVIILSFLLLNMPLVFFLMFAAFFVAVIIVGISGINRVDKLDVSAKGMAKPIPENDMGENISKSVSKMFGKQMNTRKPIHDAYKGEQITGSVFGIANQNIAEYEFLGTGRTINPENTLLFTNYRLLFIQVPLIGGDKVVTGKSYTYTNLVWNRKGIEDAGSQIIKQPMQLILKYCIREIPYSQIQNATLKKWLFFKRFLITTKDNQKISYYYLDKEPEDLLRRLFRYYLKERFKKS